jgi:hypothetical protein
MSALLETLTFGPLIAASWSLACSHALTGYVEWLVETFESPDAGGVRES